MANWVVLFIFGIIIPLTGLGVLLPRAIAALRAGGFVTKGFPVTRKQNPIRFWLAIVTWLFSAVFSVFMGAFAFWYFFTR
jgi:hypothetical protein